MKVFTPEQIKFELEQHLLWQQGKGGKMADFSKANLRGVNLEDVNLQGAYLRGANLQGANLQGANLQGANLQDAYLQGANLRGVNLQDVNLQDVYLQGVNLQDAYLPPHQTCPQEGSFIAFKKLINGAVIKLFVGKTAKRVNAIGSRKIRVSRAKVIAVVKGELNEPCGGTHYHGVRYMVGKVVKPDMFDDDIRVECTNGIHCFLTQQEAEDWY